MTRFICLHDLCGADMILNLAQIESFEFAEFDDGTEGTEIILVNGKSCHSRDPISEIWELIQGYES